MSFPVFVGKPMKLKAPAEEVATFFAKMLDHEYTTKDIFRKNFFKDWRKVRKVDLVQSSKYLNGASRVLSFILGNDIRREVTNY